MAYNVINSQLVCSDYHRTYPMIEYGSGVFLYDRDGRSWIDASGCTAAVTAIGHGVDVVADALAAQARTLAVHPTHVFHSETLDAYLGRICAFAPEGFNRAWTISGGTEAVENGIKLSFQYHKAKGRTSRTKVVGRWGSYHGNSLTTLDVGGLLMRRDYYTALMVDHLHVAPCFPYRRPEGQSLQAYEDDRVSEFADLVAAHPDEIICFVAEPIVGSALGAAGPTARYFERIAEICRSHDILMVADEVMTGFGRTGRNFGCEHFGAHADILCCAKGISGGYLPLGAIIAHDRVLEPIRASGSPFFSGQTYSCTPLAAAVGDAVLTYIQQHALVDNAATVGAHLKGRFDELRDLPCVGDVRGEGLFLGLEFVADQRTKAIIDPDKRFAKAVETAALDEGLVTYACRGTVDGTRGDHMLFAPPLTLTTPQADLIYDRLRAAIVRVCEPQR